MYIVWVESIFVQGLGMGKNVMLVDQLSPDPLRAQINVILMNSVCILCVILQY